MTKSFITISICLPVLAFWNFLYNWVCWAFWLCFEQDLLAGGVFDFFGLFFNDMVMVSPELCPSVKALMPRLSSSTRKIAQLWTQVLGTVSRHRHRFFELEWYANSCSPSTSALYGIYMWTECELIHRFYVPVMPCQLMRRVTGRTVLEPWCSLTMWKNFQADSLEDSLDFASGVVF